MVLLKLDETVKLSKWLEKCPGTQRSVLEHIEVSWTEKERCRSARACSRLKIDKIDEIQKSSKNSKNSAKRIIRKVLRMDENDENVPYVAFE